VLNIQTGGRTGHVLIRRQRDHEWIAPVTYGVLVQLAPNAGNHTVCSRAVHGDVVTRFTRQSAEGGTVGSTEQQTTIIRVEREATRQKCATGRPEKRPKRQGE